jgi:GT2 family glycosyltransferase
LYKTSNDGLLLNSDTKVTENFLEEMIAVLYAQDDIAAVSPRSNNATITTIPLRSASQKGIGADESYRLYTKIKDKLPTYHEVPVAHGFCMLIRRSVIKEYGLFDTAFGKGYGEEVDFCMRVKRHGFICVLANHAYVFHLEARSFTPELKQRLLDENNKIIWARYPGYRQSVRDYMERAVPLESSFEPEPHMSSSLRLKHKIKMLSPRAYHLVRRAKNRLQH